jgi:hypothetical protein
MKPLAVVSLTTAIALAQVQAQLKNNVIRAAEKMPEESCGFTPSHDVRSLVQQIGSAEFNFRGTVLGEKTYAWMSDDKSNETAAFGQSER